MALKTQEMREPEHPEGTAGLRCSPLGSPKCPDQPSWCGPTGMGPKPVEARPLLRVFGQWPANLPSPRPLGLPGTSFPDLGRPSFPGMLPRSCEPLCPILLFPTPCLNRDPNSALCTGGFCPLPQLESQKGPLCSSLCVGGRNPNPHRHPGVRCGEGGCHEFMKYQSPRRLLPHLYKSGN